MPQHQRHAAVDRPAPVAPRGSGGEAPERSPVPVAFLLPRDVAAVLGDDELPGLLEWLGFELLFAADLPSVARDASGPDEPTAHVYPSRLLLTVQYGWRPPTPEQLSSEPHVTNGFVGDAMVRLRARIAASDAAEAPGTPVQAATDPDRVWHLVRRADPFQEAGLRALVRRRQEDFATSECVVADLSRGRRAKVEVVERGDKVVVKKTYAPHALRYMERELDALASLAPHVSAVPTVLERGRNWFTIPWYADQLQPLVLEQGRLLPLPIVDAMVGVLSSVHERGWVVLDAKPQNFVFDRRRGLKLLDYEFAFPGLDQPPFADDQHVGEMAAQVPLDLPVGQLNYDTQWRPWTGLARSSLVRSRTWQRIERSLYTARRRAKDVAARRGLDGRDDKAAGPPSPAPSTAAPGGRTPGPSTRFPGLPQEHDSMTVPTATPPTAAYTPDLREFIRLVREDLVTHENDRHSPGFQALLAYRLGRFRYSVEFVPVRKLLSLLYRFLQRRSVRHGIEIRESAVIGRRVRIAHQGAIIFHRYGIVGDDCIVRQGVTMGRSELGPPQDDFPTLGQGVHIGVGAVIVGNVVVGDGARIGPNSVVTTNVPEGAMVVAPTSRVLKMP